MYKGKLSLFAWNFNIRTRVYWPYVSVLYYRTVRNIGGKNYGESSYSNSLSVFANFHSISITFVPYANGIKFAKINFFHQTS